MSNKDYKTLQEFYPFYLEEHSNKVNRILHFIGTTLVIFVALRAIISLTPSLLLVALLIGYGFAWVGHFIFEKNRPATFKYPLYSFVSDFKMWWELLTQKISFNPKA